MKVTILEARGISKAYGSKDILKDINFRVERGDRIGIVGPNGAGKTTLMKIIAGIEPADSGEIYMPEQGTTGYLAQDAALDAENSIWEEMLTAFEEVIKIEARMHELEHKMAEGATDKATMTEYARLSDMFAHLDGYSYESYARGVLIGLGFSPDEFNRPVHTLSGGQKTRVALGRLLLQKPQLLLLDEPTNHLDIEATQWLEDFLRNYAGTVMIISHDRYFMDAVCNKVFDIESTGLTAYEGNYSRYVVLKREVISQQAKAYELQQKEIKRQQEVIERFRSYNREKSIRAAESRQKALDRMELIDKPPEQDSIRFEFKARTRSANEVLKVESVSKYFGGKCVLNNGTFELRRGQRAAIIGPNGIGKSTLLKIIAGQLDASSGRVLIGQNTSMGYYDQEHAGLNRNNMVLEELWDPYPLLTQTDVRNILAVFLFRGDDAFKMVDDLSGGERARLALAKLMPAGDNMLLLDEPTNHLDISAREALEDALKDYDGTLITVSHDRYFINKIADIIIELTDDGINIYNGNYDYYWQQKREQAAPQSIAAPAKAKTKSLKKSGTKVQAEEPDIEAEIMATEDKIAQIEAAMCDPEIYTDGQKMRDLTEQLSTLKADLEALYEKWA